MSGPSRRWRRPSPWLLTCSIALAVVTDVAGRSAISDRVVRTLTVGPAHVLAIAVGNGDVRIDGADRSDVQVSVERHAPNAALLTRLVVDITEDASGPYVQAVQRDGGRDPELRADVRVLVPRTLPVDAVRVHEGRVEVHGLHGRVTAAIERGPIVAEDVSGAVRLETTLGAIEVTRARLTPGGVIRLRAFNGDVRLAFAAPPDDARVLALALNGTITSSLPLTAVTGWGPRWAETSIGRADRVVSIDVVNGGIHIDAPK